MGVTRFLFAAYVAVVLAAFGAVLADVYVAPDGDDAGRGTRNDPFATIARVRDAVREMKELLAVRS